MLFARGATWIGLLAYFALFAGASRGLSVLVADPALAYRIAGPFTFLAASLLQYALWALIALFLARALGGEMSSGTAAGLWAALALAYFVFGIVPPGLAQEFIGRALEGDLQMALPAATGLNLFWSSLFFPLLVWMAAAGHSGRTIGFKAIFGYLTGPGFGLWGLYIVLLLASLLLDLAVNRVLGGEATVAFGLLLQQAVAALRTLGTVLFAISAYREVAAASEG